MISVAAGFKAFESLNISQKGEKITIEFNEQVEDLSLEEWKQPENVVGLAQELGIPRETLFLKISNALAGPDAETFERIRLLDLGAERLNKKVELSLIVVGEGEPKSLPKTVLASCDKCGTDVEVIDLSNPLNSHEYLEMLIFDEREAIRRHAREQLKLENPACKHNFRIKEFYGVDYRQLYVKDPVSELEKFDSRTYRPMLIHLVKNKVPPARRVKVKGWVVSNPKTRDLTIIANEIEPEEIEFTSFKITEDDKRRWIETFGKMNIKDIADCIAPHIVGEARRKAKEAILLVLHSPPMIPDVEGRLIPGIIRAMFFGDTKTGKSEITIDITYSFYKLGEYTEGESSSRAGVTYSIDTERRIINWGILALNDLGLVAIDGIEKIMAEELAEMKEAMTTLRIVVRRFIQGEALARTRIIACLNPPKPLNQYAFKCQAITDSYVFRDKPSMTRWDIFIPFSASDVSKSEIAFARSGERPIEREAFKRHVYWVWSRRPEQIEYSLEAKEKIKKRAEEIMVSYTSEEIPIVHNGFRDVLTKIAVGFAAIQHSTDETHEKIIVTEKHVEEAVAWLEDLFQMLQLNEYVAEEKRVMSLSREEARVIAEELDDVSNGILELLKKGAMSSRQLAERLRLSDRTIKERYSTLEKHGLIRARQKVGVELTPRGILFLKLMTAEQEEAERSEAK